MLTDATHRRPFRRLSCSGPKRPLPLPRTRGHMPIIDYHCHLPPPTRLPPISGSTTTRIWLDGDHYKWRAMRTNGVPNATSPAGRRLWFKVGRSRAYTVSRSATGRTWNCAAALNIEGNSTATLPATSTTGHGLIYPTTATRSRAAPDERTRDPAPRQPHR